MSGSFKKQIVKGVVWSAVERFSVQGVQFVLTIILARLVTPSEYGLIAMLGIFLAIAQTFIDSGFSNALVQKKNRTETDYSTVFYFNIIIAVLIYSILCFLAPFIANFYQESQLEKIVYWTGINLIISSFSIVQRAKLTIELDFKLQAKISLSAVIISGLSGIILAWKGYGVWALVAQGFLNNVLSTVGFWMFTRWKPIWVFSVESFKRLFSFGSKLLLSGIMHTIYINLYTLVIGRQFNAVNVGYFNRSQTLAMFPSTNITEIISRVMYPSLCGIQDEEDRLKNVFLKYLRIVSFIIFPLMIGLSVLSEPFIEVILTDKWVSAAPLLSILSIAYMLHSIAMVNWQIINVKGRSDLNLKAEFFRKIIAFVILFSTIPLGIKGMCFGFLFCNLTDIVILVLFARKIISISYLMEIKVLFPIVLSSLVMGIGVYFVMQLFSTPILKLSFGILSGIVLYLGLCTLLKLPEVKILINNPFRIFRKLF